MLQPFPRHIPLLLRLLIKLLHQVGGRRTQPLLCSVRSVSDVATALTYLSVARNGDLNGIVSSMKQMEDRFNKKFNYPYVFLNEEPFSEEFKT
jgi:hypothetical protein